MYNKLKNESDALGIDFDNPLSFKEDSLEHKDGAYNYKGKILECKNGIIEYEENVFDDLDEKIEKYRHILPQKIQNDSIYKICNSYERNRSYNRTRGFNRMNCMIFIYPGYKTVVSNYIRLYEMVNDKKRQNDKQSDEKIN